MLDRDYLRTLSIDQLFALVENLAVRLSRHESRITQLEESSDEMKEYKTSLDCLIADYRYQTDRNQDLEAKLSFYYPEERD
ncbi:MAG: hypothetical protein HC849_14550 [Oscillatoriales cyanobacterium RU_3_3]|nr:hypothetical protein [Microcoleus sp. SU_5_6]NJL66264.1 hypothetical protein [Microcoleus sp. SM1_3_4]NJM61150.1 hypothetical protein [Oscillatoriales cyanobacterium RU_3_3]NJR24620.1 hypothetical protein [Richelia sp. CSU_2_1]